MPLNLCRRILNLASRRCVKEHHVALDETVIQKLLGMLAGNVGHKAGRLMIISSEARSPRDI